ncbi:hypothetical protein RDI58_004060 [Solanum bulbocastanum]|uniref:Uncharacterized protein n=1 Tax=Solanum bulbocastanum TaxID=147425 RepID=A0AAN8YJS7_SOLBU
MVVTIEAMVLSWGLVKEDQINQINWQNYPMSWDNCSKFYFASKQVEGTQKRGKRCSTCHLTTRKNATDTSNLLLDTICMKESIADDVMIKEDLANPYCIIVSIQV